MSIYPHDADPFCYCRHVMPCMSPGLRLKEQQLIAESLYRLAGWAYVARRRVEAGLEGAEIVSLLVQYAKLSLAFYMQIKQNRKKASSDKRASNVYGKWDSWEVIRGLLTPVRRPGDDDIACLLNARKSYAVFRLVKVFET